jgi:hypothetical protein
MRGILEPPETMLHLHLPGDIGGASFPHQSRPGKVSLRGRARAWGFRPVLFARNVRGLGLKAKKLVGTKTRGSRRASFDITMSR